MINLQYNTTFPSPLGDYVFNQNGEDIRIHIAKFPSPLGDYVFNQSDNHKICPRTGVRFRPLSGIMFSIRRNETDTGRKLKVSVPSRGLCFQSLSAKTCTLPYSALIVAAQMHKVVYIH